VAAADAAVVEDSGNGVAASVAAGLRTVVTVSAYTGDDDFTGASLIVSSLGDPGEPARVIADPYGIVSGELVTLADIAAVITHPLPPRPTE
jgi:hypothetical protein